MKSDAIVIGAELDGLLAAARLVQQGRTAQMLCTGAGGLHYAPAGLHVLGFKSGDCKETVVDPISSITDLNAKHPYHKIGRDGVAAALSWFSGFSSEIGIPVTLFEKNVMALTPAGLGLPVFGAPAHLATLVSCKDKVAAIISFPGMRDFPVELISVGLGEICDATHKVEAPLPGKLTENVALAKSFDRLSSFSDYFAALKPRIPTNADVVLFPAVMGLRRSSEVLATAENILGLPCMEVPTLPASVPGLRLELALREYLQERGVDTIGNFEPGSALASPDGVIVSDSSGRRFEADIAILATGGVLMSGLEVQSNGHVRERFFDLDVVQTGPLSVTAVDLTLDALHTAGVETSETLNPVDDVGRVTSNLFVTGQTLAHCNPAAESSADGLSIATGWAAAQHALTYLKGAKNG